MEQQSDDHTKAELKTMASCMESMQKKGFTENFMVKEGYLHDLGTEKTYTPQQVKIPNFFRFEGESDPADSSILYAIETDDGVRGLLSDSYGPYSDMDVTNFINEVQEINKKTNKGQKI